MTNFLVACEVRDCKRNEEGFCRAKFLTIINYAGGAYCALYRKKEEIDEEFNNYTGD